MKSFDVAKFREGVVTEIDYFSGSGELLIPKGTTITQSHLQALSRRNIFELFAKEDEIEQILSHEFEELEDIEDGDPVQKSAEDLIPLIKVPDGKKGLEQLLNAKRVTEIDKKLEKEDASDRPQGVAFKEKLSQIEISQRSHHYKDSVASAYNDSLNEVSVVLRSIANGELIDGIRVKNILRKFMNIFITDRNILLNISGQKHSSANDYLFHHSLNVCLLSINIAASAGYSEEQVIEIGMGALLHDIGMLHIPQNIRDKRGRLTNDDLYEIQKHPVIGLHLLEKMPHMPWSVPIVAYQTHERENGRGYPRHRTKRLIHRYAKIVQLADIYEAISSPRPYREAMAPYYGIETLLKMTRKGFVSGDFVKAFLTYVSLFPVGSIVELSNRCIGRVVATNGTSYAKPVVSIIVDDNGQKLEDTQIYQIDLKLNTELQISRSYRYDYIRDLDVMKGF